jgi:hypothetical protein
VIDVLDETVDLSPSRHITPAEDAATPAQTAERMRRCAGQGRPPVNFRLIDIRDPPEL